jgi:hypothetical protein
MPRGRSLWTLNYARHKERIIRLRKFIEAWRAPPVPKRACACVRTRVCARVCACVHMRVHVRLLVHVSVCMRACLHCAGDVHVPRRGRAWTNVAAPSAP